MAKIKYDMEFKSKIITDFKNGMKSKDIAEKYKINKSTLSKIIKKFKTYNTVETFHLGGRPRKTTPRTDRRIVTEFQKDPLASGNVIKKKLDLNISSWTINRRAKESGLHSFSAAKKPLLSEKNRKARLNFARKYADWSITKWKTVLFSDEKKFNMFGSDGRIRVRRPKGKKRLDPKYCTPTVKHGGGSVMVWGSFSGQGMGPIHNVQGIMFAPDYKAILENVMAPYAEENMPLLWYFQHDNDPKHKAKVVTKWFEDNNIQVLDWPAQSPDLNPIENLWAIVDKKIRGTKYSNKTALYAAVENEWKSTPSSLINSLICSMPNRCHEVIKNNGYWTHY